MKPRYPLTCLDAQPGRAALEREAAARAQQLAIAVLTCAALLVIAIIIIR
jgi:hypothetical protein